MTSLAEQIVEVRRWLIMSESVSVPIGKKGAVYLVDREDLHLLAMFNWYDEPSGYLRRPLPGVRKITYFHRDVLCAPAGLVVDHINGNTWDNRKANLRIVTHRQNSINSKAIGRTSKYKGVSWNKERSKWIASTNSGSFVKHTSHSTEREAAREYDARARVLHGEYARLNFPDATDRSDTKLWSIVGAIATLEAVQAGTPPPPDPPPPPPKQGDFLNG